MCFRNFLWVSFFVLVFPLYCFSGTYKGFVFKVVDGDTIHFQKENSDIIYKVRFLGIDTPELHYNGQSQGIYAEKARVYLENNIPVGTKVSIVYEGGCFDKYGRLLGHVFYGSRNINKELLREGLAVNYAIYPNLNYVDEYAEATKYAVLNAKGMFQDEDIELPFEFRMRIRGGTPDKWVGDRTTKQYYIPMRYTSIEIWNRVFFFEEDDALDYGFIFVD